eukprot:scaffold20738_cov113-Isochrysis_galbana.AAC.3
MSSKLMPVSPFSPPPFFWLPSLSLSLPLLPSLPPAWPLAFGRFGRLACTRCNSCRSPRRPPAGGPGPPVLTASRMGGAGPGPCWYPAYSWPYILPYGSCVGDCSPLSELDPDGAAAAIAPWYSPQQLWQYRCRSRSSTKPTDHMPHCAQLATTPPPPPSLLRSGGDEARWIPSGA